MNKQTIQRWNDDNPTLRKKTLTSIANEIGCSKSYLSNFGKKQLKSIGKARLKMIAEILGCREEDVI